jgi:hypothetical protein
VYTFLPFLASFVLPFLSVVEFEGQVRPDSPIATEQQPEITHRL